MSLATLLAGGVALAAPAGGHPAAEASGRNASSQAAAPKPGTGNFVQRLIDDLRRTGLEVSVGYPKLYAEEDCSVTYPVSHNCYGNNPAAPYVMPIVKSWPEEYMDPAIENVFGRTRPGYSATYRLDPREAIVFFGRMPPPARYFGMQTWLFTTGWARDESPWDKDAWSFYAARADRLIQYLFATVPGNPSRLQSLSSVDNNINNAVMEKQSGPPWDKLRYLVITPDQRTDEAVRASLYGLGVDRSEIFTEGIPRSFEGGPVGPLGLGDKAVDFVTMLRYAMPDDEQAGDVWRKSLPLTVLRVRRSSAGPDPMPYDDRWADARIGVDEKYLMPDLNALVDAVARRAESQGLKLEAAVPTIEILNDLGQFGPDCRKIGMNCLGDNQDASFFLMRMSPLDTGKIYALVGTLASETGNATYVGLSVNDGSLLKGVLNVSDTKLKGSASGYASGGYGPILNADKFFVHFFARECKAIANLADGACTSITRKMIPLASDDKAPGDAALHGMLAAAVRAYVKPGSLRGPDPRKQLRPRVLTFSYSSP